MADLDSIVDASQTIEEQIEMEELHKELSVRKLHYLLYPFYDSKKGIMLMTSTITNGGKN